MNRTKNPAKNPKSIFLDLNFRTTFYYNL